MLGSLITEQNANRSASTPERDTIAAGYKYRDELTDLVQHRIPDSDAAQNSVSHSNLMERFLNGLLLYKPWLSDQGRLEFVEQMDNHVLPWPWRSLGWSQYAYGLGARVPDEYQSHIPPGVSREELAVFPLLFFTSIHPTKEVLERVRQLGEEDSAVESEHRSHSKAALAGTNG